MGWRADETLLDQAITMGDYSGELVVDPESPLETLFGLPLMAGLIAVFFSGCFLFLLKTGIMKGDEALAWTVLGKGLLLSLMGWAVRSTVDVHYRLNEDSRTVQLCRRFMTWRFRKTVCSFSDVKSLLIDHTHTRIKESGNRYSDKYEYGLLMCLNDGSTVRLLDRSYENYNLLSDRVARVAAMLGTVVQSESKPTGVPILTSGSGCFKAGCLFIVVSFLFTTCSHRGRPGDHPRRPHQQSKVGLQGDSQEEFIKVLHKSGQAALAMYFEGGLVTVKADPAIWKEAYITDSKVSRGKFGQNLFQALASSPSVVSSVGKKLDVPLKREGKPKKKATEILRSKISLQIEILGSVEPKSLPILSENLFLGMQYLAGCSPKHGQARLILRLAPGAVPEILSQENGVTVGLPSDQRVPPNKLSAIVTKKVPGSDSGATAN